MIKGTRIYSILNKKCPRCQEGDFFEGSYFKGNPKEHCDKCELKYEKEPGFFQGSYYVAYALGVAALIAFGVASIVLFPGREYDFYMWIVLGGMLVSFPFTYPLSKIIWANFFYHYEKDSVKPKHSESNN